MELTYQNKKSLQEIERKIADCLRDYSPIKTDNKYGLYINDDNFCSMVKLLPNYESKIDLVYIDPPFNTNSTFFYNKERTATISHSQQDLIAYEDNLSLDEYLEFIRERVVLIHKLLSPQGTLYFHIDTKVGHYIKIILDEIFGAKNFVNDITRVKSNPKNFDRKAFGNKKDVIYVYAKNFGHNIFNNVTEPLSEEQLRKLFTKQDKNGRLYTTVPCHAPGETKNGSTSEQWKGLFPPKGRHWRVSPKELDRLDQQGLIEWSKTGNPRIIKYSDDHKGQKIQDIWVGFKDPQYPVYPTEKNISMLDMIVKQSSNENSIIMDCFCGSGSFLKAGLNNHRFVIGIDKSCASKDCLLCNETLKKLECL